MNGQSTTSAPQRLSRTAAHNTRVANDQRSCRRRLTHTHLYQSAVWLYLSTRIHAIHAHLCAAHFARDGAYGASHAPTHRASQRRHTHASRHSQALPFDGGVASTRLTVGASALVASSASVTSSTGKLYAAASDCCFNSSPILPRTQTHVPRTGSPRQQT